jgi:hypothetical protein
MLPVTRLIGHKEYGNTPPGGYPGRKGDPRYSMDWRRARVASFQPRTGEDDMPSAKDVVDELLERTVTLKNGDTPRIKTVLAALVDRAKTEQADLDDIQARLANIEAKLAAPAEPPAA